MTDDTATIDGPPMHLLTGAYALHALSDQEREAFEAHLRGCDACATETAELIVTATRLAFLTERPAPEHLRATILREVERTPQRSPEAAEPTGAVIDLETRRRDRTRRLTLAAGAALATAAAIVGAVLVFGNDPDSMGEILAADDARTFTGDVTGGGEAVLVVSQEQDGAVITFADLPDPGADHTYQMWLIEGDNPPVPEDVFDPSAGGSASVLLEGAPGADAVALTIEPDGGSTAPTTTPIVVIALGA